MSTVAEVVFHELIPPNNKQTFGCSTAETLCVNIPNSLLNLNSSDETLQ